MRLQDSVMAVLVIAVILLIIIPLNPVIMDVMLILNLSLSLVVLLVTLYTKEPLQFSVFPSMLLICTLFRLALNVSSTRLILGNGGYAGNVIQTFGSFVVRGNLIVGFVVFLIIVIIQFIVITKGAERVAEVAARFTLDALPGKQMSIDADLNAGLIGEDEARDRRAKLRRETDFYGSMDGASKFVKGDAIVAVIITLINSIGGVLMGMVAGGMSLNKVLEVYILATVGDGLSNQMAALMIAVAAGIIVTRASSQGGLGSEVAGQIFDRPVVLLVAAGMLAVMMLIPGFPKPILLIMGGVLLFLGLRMMRRQRERQVTELEAVPPRAETELERYKNPDKVYDVLGVDAVRMEFGYSLIPLVDTGQGGGFLDRVAMIRRQCAVNLGLVVPSVRLQDNMQLSPNMYAVYIRGEEVARGEVLPNHLLAMNIEDEDVKLDGIDVNEPVFGAPAKWIIQADRDKAELAGATLVDPLSVMATHLHEIIKRHAHELLGRQDVQAMIDTVKKTHPSLVEEVVPKLLSLGEVQKVLASLLREGVPVRDLVAILEALGNHAPVTRDTALLTEYVRQALRRTITRTFVGEGKEAKVITVDPRLEQQILDSIRQTDYESRLALAPQDMKDIVSNLTAQVQRMSQMGLSPVVLVSPAIRMHMRRLAEQVTADIAVLSYSEIEHSTRIRTVGVVTA